ncbi:MAG: polysaccharide deacetylase family protein [Rhodospirillales bacterium]|nr:polysaccharide deacetylase family protein [Rhodospirillales bacterium]MBO6787562.1 polysaccharide deacetylase family protein [Rhodospirillales bacterium]
MISHRILPLLAVILSIVYGAGFGPIAPSQVSADEPTTKAVVIMYHRFGETDFPSTNVTMEQFRAHVAELRTGGYNVASLPKIIAALHNGEALPPKTVGLSVDDAYESVYTRAWPILKEAGFPLTVFVATDPVERGLSRYMSWDQLKEIAEQGVTIGSQTKSHPHMADLSAEAIKSELRISNALFEEKLGHAPDLFAYPYGETSNEVMALVKSEGFVAAFGQHSGAFGSGSDMYYLPRFAMNESFGSIDRFKLAANALPMRAADITPDDPTVTTPNPPLVGFTLTWPATGLDRLNCYSSHVEKVDLQRLGKRIEVRMDTAMPHGRTRLNCTMPAGDGRWYWFGRQFYVPK